MVGHISIGQRMLSEKIAGMDAEARASAAAEGLEPVLFPERLRLLLEHMLLAHHGKLEFGSPKLPMTPEALLLSALDDLEAKFQTVRGEFAAAEAAGRGVEQPTEWVRSMERNLFDSGRYLGQTIAAAAPAAPAEQAQPAPEMPQPAREEPEMDVPSFTLRLLD